MELQTLVSVAESRQGTIKELDGRIAAKEAGEAEEIQQLGQQLEEEKRRASALENDVAKAKARIVDLEKETKEWERRLEEAHTEDEGFNVAIQKVCVCLFFWLLFLILFRCLLLSFLAVGLLLS